MTKSNNTTRTKANAVFFAAVMVISMVAIGFAVAPAAAVGNNADVTFDDQTLSGDDTVSVDADADGEEGTVLVTYEEDGDTILAGSESVDGEEEVDVEIEDTDGFPGNHTAHIAEDDSNLAEDYEPGDAVDDDEGDSIVSDDARVYDGDVSLDSGSTTWQGQELGFAIDSLEDGDQLQVRNVDDDDDVAGLEDEFSVGEDGFATVDTESLEDGEYVIVDADNNDQTYKFDTGVGTASSDDGTADDESFEVATQDFSTEFEDEEVAQEDVDLEVDTNRGSSDVTVDADGDLDDDELLDIFVNNGDFEGDVGDEDDDDEITLEDVSDDDVETNFSEIDTGDYEFTFDVTDTEAEDTASINVTEEQDGELDVSEAAVEQQGDVAAINVELDNTDEGNLVIGNEEDDGYQANVSIEDDEDDEVTVLFNTYLAGSGASLDDVVYTEDDDAEIDVEGETDDLENILDTGTYDLSVGPNTGDDAEAFEETLDDPDTISSLSIEERGDTELALWRTGENVEEDIADELDDENESATVSLIADSVEDDLVTEGDTLAVDEEDGDYSDVQVHQLSASGLQGPLANASDDPSDVDSTNALYEYLQETNNEDDNDADDNSDKLEIVFEEQDPGANQEAKEIDLNELANDDEISDSDFSDLFTVVYDEDNDDYYIVLNTDNLNDLEDDDLDDDDLNVNIEDEDEYEVQTSVQDARLLDILDEDDEDAFEDAFESASASFTAEEAEGEFDNEDEIEVEAADEQELTGTTNVAPGTEFDVRVRSDDDASTSFIENDEDLAVSADGTFTSEFDFSEQEVNDTFTAEVRQAGFDADSDGTVVEQTEDPASFEVSDLDPEEATATQGDEVTVSATIENTGEAEGTQDVALT
ncbi:BGTF surface domain-containing protein, partial [Halorubrum sp. AD140]|uniref:DUF7827 domain-containing protein n=1 Tax=Halorubrum sp. AD140 TaxID=3050073 RepID=UPI002ACC513D